MVRAANLSTSADEAAITSALLGGTGTFVNGAYSADGSTTTSVDLGISNNTEYEFWRVPGRRRRRQCRHHHAEGGGAFGHGDHRDHDPDHHGQQGRRRHPLVG
jgi:hypothetical protein